jgi:hypothetical protein
MAGTVNFISRSFITKNCLADDTTLDCATITYFVYFWDVISLLACLYSGLKQQRLREQRVEGKLKAAGHSS